MRPIITPEEMRRVDEAVTEPLTSIIDRVGALVAMQAIDLLGGTYGRRVVVVAGPGNNGADGRAAAKHLTHRGVRCVLVEVGEPVLPNCDLVIDAAFGTGLSRDYQAPTVPEGAMVLSVDIASGYDGLTGAALGVPFSADRTIVLGAMKPGNLFEPARSACGARTVVDIGLDSTALISPGSYEVEAADVAQWLPKRAAETHKWKAACWVLAGSPGMTGAADLTARGAQRGGASYVRLSSPGGVEVATNAEIVTTPISAALETPEIDRFASMVIGPGLGRAAELTQPLFDLIGRAALPLVIDADALWHLGADRVRAQTVLQQRTIPAILTPHNGEFARLFGSVPVSDRIDAAQQAADEFGSVVLLKGATTVIAAPGDPAFVMADGDTRLASAGTGDVLAGLIGAFLASGLGPHHSASAGAFIHAKAATLGPNHGLIAGDLPNLIPSAIAELAR